MPNSNVLYSALGALACFVGSDPLVADALDLAQDTYTRTDNPSRNFGTSNTMWVSHRSARQAYLNFAPSTLPGGSAESAELGITLAALPNDGEVGLHVVQSEWSESAITANMLPAIDPAPLATASVTQADAGSPLRFDVMSAVSGWQADPSGNAAPVAENDNCTVDQSTAGIVLDVLSNDSDADLPVDTLQIVSVGSTSDGGLVVNNASSVSYTPRAGFAGTESFDYTIADSVNVESTATVYVVVTANEDDRTWRIMPIGDSITEASGSRNSYRRPLWHLLYDMGVNIDFVGSRRGNRDGQAPKPDFDTDHEGHWGWKADRFLNDDNIAKWSSMYRPDIILIHLGTNDIFGGQSVSSTIDEIGRIVEIVRDANPRVIALIATIIPTSDPSRPSLLPFNQAIPELVALKNQPNSPVLLVDQFSGFDASVDTYDGVHPDLSGERKMAQKWFGALRTLISPD
jgi:lysophospholipase L1-like esterase